MAWYSVKDEDGEWRYGECEGENKPEFAARHNTRGAAIRKILESKKLERAGRMSPGDFTRHRTRYGTQKAYAKALGVARRTLEDWESAKRPIPESIRRLTIMITELTK